MKYLNFCKKIFPKGASDMSMTPKEFETLQRENEESRNYTLPSTNTSMPRGRSHF